MKPLSHIDENGEATMVDVSGKQATHRTARAQARVHLGPDVMAKLVASDLHTAKGSLVHTAIVAGIMAAKKTGDLIPLCHPLQTEHVQVHVQKDGDELVIECTASLHGKTGVEMEAMTGAAVAALTVYDMCKALSHRIEISSVKLMEKTGGKHDFIR